MKILIAGGTGYIGSALVEHWKTAPHTLTILSRNLAKVGKHFGQSVAALDWDHFRKDPTAHLSMHDVVINLCGDNAAECRWSEARKQQIRDVRIKPTCELASACAQLGVSSPHLISASGVSVYGLQDGQTPSFPPAFCESSDVTQETPGFMPKMAREWEAATNIASEANVPVTLARFGMILSKAGGALPKLAMPYYFGVGGRVGNGNQPMSWVSMVDVCHILDFLIARRELTGPVNFSGIQSVRQIEFAHALATTLHRPAFFPLPAWVVKAVFGQMGDEFLLKGQNTIPDRLINAGYEFKHPDVTSCLQAIYSK